MRLLVLIAAAALLLSAQDPHWGVQGDLAYANVPGFIVDRIHAVPERPDITGQSFNPGIVRFHANGSPSCSFSYTSIRASGFGALARDDARAEVNGSASIRGAMVTKYLNFFSRDHVSFGIGVGGGLGQLRAFYIRRATARGRSFTEPPHRYEYTIPVFELLGQLDVRPVRYLSVGPIYGFRTGAQIAGGGIKLHFVR